MGLIDSAFDAIGDVVGGAGDVVSGVVDTVKDSGLGPVIGSALALTFAPVTGGASLALWAAIGASAGTLLTGGSIGDAIKNGGLAYVGGELFGAAGGAAGEGAAAGSQVASAAGEQVGSTLAADVAGVSTDPAKMLTASVNPNPLGTTMTDAPIYDMPASAPPAPSAAPGGDQLRDAVNGMNGGGGGGGGLINSAMEFAKANPILTAAGLQVGGGALAGMGNRANALEVANRKIAGDKELQNQKVGNAIELEEWKRKFAQGGSYFDALIPFRRSTNQSLTRPDGSAVYGNNGLIASAMNG